MATPALVPSRVAPASIMTRAAASSRMPPDAFTPIWLQTVSRRSAPASRVAPPTPKPVASLITVPFSVLNSYIPQEAPEEENCTQSYWAGGKCRIGAQGTEGFAEPNHGVRVGNDFVFINASGWDRVGADEQLAKDPKAPAPELRRVSLR